MVSVQAMVRLKAGRATQSRRVVRTIVRPAIRYRSHGHSRRFVGRHEVDSRPIEVEPLVVWTSTLRPAAQPDQADDARVAVRHDGGGHDEDVRRQKREVGFALPLGRVAGALARQRRPQQAVVTGSRVKFLHLDEDEQLRSGQNERAQPTRQHLEPDVLRTVERAQWMHKHLPRTRRQAATRHRQHSQLGQLSLLSSAEQKNNALLASL